MSSTVIEVLIAVLRHAHASWADLLLAGAISTLACFAVLIFGPASIYGAGMARRRRSWNWSVVERHKRAGPHAQSAQVDQARALLVRSAAQFITTTTTHGATKADQYRVAATGYMDLAAILGTDIAERFFSGYPEVFVRDDVPADEAMCAIGSEFENLAFTVRWELVGFAHPNLSRYVGDRLKGFLEGSH